MKKNNYGFTLVEILVTVTILAIIAAIAIPTYQNVVIKSNRTDAKTALNTLSNELARFYAVNRTYTTDMTNFSLPSATAASALSEYGNFRVSIAAGADGIAKNYVISATTESVLQKRDSNCVSFSMTSAGQKSALNKTSGDSTTNCW